MKEMAMSPQQHVFGHSKLLDLPKYCLECEYCFACHGECLKHRFETTPDGEYGLNYMCKAYKMFFSWVNPYMQYMGDEFPGEKAACQRHALDEKIQAVF